MHGYYTNEKVFFEISLLSPPNNKGKKYTSPNFHDVYFIQKIIYHEKIVSSRHFY